MQRFRASIARWRGTLAAVIALAAAGCMALSAYHFRPQGRALIHYRPTPGGPQNFYDPSAPWWALAGALLLVVALALARHVLTAPPHRPGPLLPLRPRWAWLFLAPGMLALLVLAETNGRWTGIDALHSVHPAAQLALFGTGIALVAVGLGGVPPLFSRAHRSRESTYRVAGEIALLLALTAAALALRLYRLGDSIHVLVDEAHFVLGVNYARLFPDLRLLEPMPTTASFPFLFSYGQKLAVDIFGRNLLGLRAFSAVLGALTVPATYWLGRQLFDRTTALAGALVLLAFPPHLHYSRLALNNIADPLFGTLALACMARGLRTRRRIDWALAGAMLGLAQYFYEGGRLIYPALAAAWLAFGMLAWRPRSPLRGVLIAALAFALVAAPLYYTLLGVDFPFTDRMDKAGYNDLYWSYEREPDNLTTRARHFWHALLHLVHAPENTVFHYYLYYGGRHPLVLEWLVPLLLLGAVIALWRWREPGILLPGWVLATLAGNALLVESAVSARFVLAFPALALLIAVGLRHTLALTGFPVLAALLRDRQRASRVLATLVLLLGVGIAAGQGVYYFGPHLDRFNAEVREFPSADAEDALLRAADFPRVTFVHLVGTRLLPQRDAQHFADFLTDGLVVQVHAPDAITPILLHSLRRDVPHAFFVEPGERDVLALLAATFGTRPVQGTPSPRVPEGKALLLYYVPRDPFSPGPSPGAAG